MAPPAAALPAGAVPAGCTQEFGDYVRCVFGGYYGMTARKLNIPAEVRSVTVEASGAEGGSVLVGDRWNAGGLGMTAVATVAVNPDKDLEIVVGGDGKSGVPGRGGRGGLQFGAAPDEGGVFPSEVLAGHGGGASLVRVAGTTTPLVVGAGGGGAGAGYDGMGGGDAHAGGFGPQAGAAATATAPGAGGPGARPANPTTPVAAGAAAGSVAGAAALRMRARVCRSATAAVAVGPTARPARTTTSTWTPRRSSSAGATRTRRW
jgi:hypothetical protein